MSAKKKQSQNGKLAGKSVTTGKLAGKSVKTGKLAGQAVTESKLGDESVTSSKLGDQSVTTSKLGDESVTTSKLSDDSVSTSKLSDDSVTASKLGDGSVKSDELGEITKVEESSPPAAVPPINATANCPAGSKVLSGGFEVTSALDPNDPPIPTGDQRSNNGWEASAVAQNAGDRVIVYAYCLQQ